MCSSGAYAAGGTSARAERGGTQLVELEGSLVASSAGGGGHLRLGRRLEDQR